MSVLPTRQQPPALSRLCVAVTLLLRPVQVLGLPVPCVSKAFGTFDGLVHALEAHFTPQGPGDGKSGPSLPHHHHHHREQQQAQQVHVAGPTEGHRGSAVQEETGRKHLVAA